MSHVESLPNSRRNLPVILIAAVVQGWALYFLHEAVVGQHWPATRPAWLLAMYAVATLIPLSVQMLAGFARERGAWAVLAIMSVLFFYFGWHHGANVDIDPARNLVEQWLPLGFVLVVFWLLVLPFIQARLEGGRWRASYGALFANAWNNKLVLLEAALFTGSFWLLLILWQELFFVLGIAFFRDLFGEPLFIYPVTALVFGIALHLIGSLDRMTRVVLEQVLNVLKWLALLAGIILTLFTIALATKLPGMISSAERAIGAAWLLWLVAVTVLLVNAAYRDGTIERPYPRAIGLVLRFVIPLTVVIALTALYALYLRIDRYGFTVGRVWACVVALAACVYAFGYALAARDDQPWMAGIARVNVVAALLLITILGLALTPVLSPYRIASRSQYMRVLEQWSGAGEAAFDNSLHYLRWSAGGYGRKRLRQLANIQDHPSAAAIRADAAAALAQETRWQTAMPSVIDRKLREMIVRPDRPLEPDLLEAVRSELGRPERQWLQGPGQEPPIGLFIDMNGDGAEEFVLILQHIASVFERRDTWKRAIHLNASLGTHPKVLREYVERDDVSTLDRGWKDLKIGPHVFRHQIGPSEAL